MNRRLALTAVPAALVVIFIACGSEQDPDNANLGGSPAPGGMGGSGSSSGVSAGGSAGTSTSTSTSTMPGGSGGMSSTAGAAGSGDGAIPASFETVKLVLGGGGAIMPCAAAPCHGVNGMAPPARPLELPPNDDEKLYANLTTYVSKACGDMKLVTAGDPTQSAIIKILSGPCGMTPRMPYGCSADAGDCIPDEYIAAVAQWITNGAPRQ